MESKYIAILLITLLTIIITCFSLADLTYFKENFMTKREKAQKIYDWFAINKNPTYIDYKRDLGGKSNIVEYEDVKNIINKKPNLTVGLIESII